MLEENSPAEDSLSPEKDEKNVVTQISLKDVVELIQSDDLFLQLKATQAVRKMLSKQKNPPVNQVIESGIIPKLVEFLYYHDTPNLQFESAWALTNVASGTSEQTKAVIDANGIQGLVDLLSSPHIYICEQSVWALGNIADKDIISDTCWAMCYLTDGSNHRIQVVVETGVLPRLVELLFTAELPILIADKMGETEKLGLLIEELDGVEKIEALQTHENNLVYRAALTLIEKYFSGEVSGRCHQIPKLFLKSVALKEN
ncbi:hypothetical protein E2320_012202 [Naja naja]|nr:hypothetical protein E2320_012202 [Naja naja]